jgi:hypothetical protein
MRVKPHHRRLALLGALACAALAYYLLAYLLVPDAWRLHEHRHPGLVLLATRTVTVDGIPGDPINIAIVASEQALQRAMRAALWQPADPVTLAAALRILADSVVHRPYGTAPVSNLYFWGRRQDLAFEQMIGTDPRRRNHVRFWRSDQVDAQGRPLWVGAATLDTSAGVSHLTGQITHHIGAAIDQERDQLIDDLRAQGPLVVDWIDGFQTALNGRNGGGDPYYTDGRLAVVTLD